MADFLRPPADTTTGKRVHASVWNDGSNDIYTQVTHLADRLNPDQQQAVDNTGAAFTRFTNGSPDFDAFGRTTVSEPNLMAIWKFYHEDYATQFAKDEVGGATTARDATKQGIKMTNTTASGDKSGYHSHRFFHYRPGNTMTLTWTMQSGDTGKANLVRRAGWITPDNGLFFEFDSTGEYVVLRNGNLVTETKVERANWNGDRLNGVGGDNNLSSATLDETKNSIWWIDFQYLGAGAIRFGTYVNGEKIVCHTIGNYNATDRPYMSSASLSFGFEQENTGATASGSEMYVYCAVVTNDGYDEFDITPISFSAEATLTSTSFAPIVSFRPTQTHEAQDNRDRIVPQLLSGLSVSEPIEIIVEINPALTGATYATTIDAIEVDTAATAATGGTRKIGQLIAAGRSETIDLSPVFKIYKDGVTRTYDVTGSDHITISGRLLTGTTSVVSVAVNALEVE